MRGPWRRLAGLVIVTLTAVAQGPAFHAAAQDYWECFNPVEATPEIYGPTDISAATGNQSLSVALNPKGTITVFKWPSPSFYDQIKYFTSDRAQPRLGALPNEGSFIGLAWREKGNRRWQFDWLRQWRSHQRFADADTDEVVTAYKNPKVGLRVAVRDVAATQTDVLLRRVVVKRRPRSPVRRVRVVAFANFNPVFSKPPQLPAQDWCFEEQNDDGGSYVRRRDAVIHVRSGIDESTGLTSSVALVMGFRSPSEGHHIGPDTYETGSEGISAYDDAADGKLHGSEGASGQADAALFDEKKLTGRSAKTTIILGAAKSQRRALDLLQHVRARSYGSVARAKARWWRNWLASAPLPRRAPKAVTELSKRALISLAQAVDEDTEEAFPEGQSLRPGGLIVASIATQSPYGEDWIRDGAYFNYALDVIGHHRLVERRNRRYAVLQTKPGDSTRGGQPLPPGNWAMNYYADGIVGGPIPYEIDETGYGVWTMWKHYQMTKDRDYLVSDLIYEAIARGADYLTACRDLSTGLQCIANEDDNPTPTQTLRGAMIVWLGLDSAVKAARVVGPEAASDAERWEARRDELERAMEDHLFDQVCRCYATDYGSGGTLLWPVHFLDFGSQRALTQAKYNWESIAPVFADETPRGAYEAKTLLGNAYVWRDAPAKIRLLKKGLGWLVREATTPGTRILGEAWMRYPPTDGPVTAMVSQPHVWQQVLFYLTALKVYGPGAYSFR